MGARRINRFKERNNGTGTISQRQALVDAKPIHDIQTGFICHPRGFPLEIRQKWFTSLLPKNGHPSSRIGIMFESPLYYRPGKVIELLIPVHQKTESFTGTVVLVRCHAEHFEIGLWLNRGEDAGRVRIVEQLCHIEAYTKEKKYREGPYNLNPERVAREWIAKYAAGVPQPDNDLQTM